MRRQLSGGARLVRALVRPRLSVLDAAAALGRGQQRNKLKALRAKRGPKIVIGSWVPENANLPTRAL
jgi:hypothetical protein